MPEKDKSFADMIRDAVGLGTGKAGRGKGDVGQAKRRDIDRRVEEAQTGRMRAGQSTDKQNGY